VTPSADLTGKTVVVTGASSGIGLEACVRFARMGAAVVAVARDERKGARAVADIRRRGGSDRVSLEICDFASQRSVRQLAQRLRANHPRIDVLVNNAGSVSASREVTEDGIERTFAVNHLGYFLLTTLLLDVLKASAPARIVVVASIGHRQGDLDFGNLQYEHGGYSLLKAYSRSKLANVLFASELARRLAGSGVTAYSLHPGAVATRIWNHTPWYIRPVLMIAKWFMIAPERGAEPIVFLAAGPEAAGRSGEYYEQTRFVEPAPAARDRALAARLWDESVRLTGG
jgi:NAD(P)-dependent dehydrogenase (short-subunit alcohol dehydrogenase family)